MFFLHSNPCDFWWVHKSCNFFTYSTIYAEVSPEALLPTPTIFKSNISFAGGTEISDEKGYQQPDYFVEDEKGNLHHPKHRMENNFPSWLQ